LFSILSNLDDQEVFARLHPNVVPIPLLASHWVAPEIFKPQNTSKEFDVVVLANFATYKRHFALFRALRDARHLKALLLGRQWGSRTAETLRSEARYFGVLDQITIREGLDDEAMVRSLQSAKVSLMLSMNEGSCVAVAESLFADVPVGLLRGANIGSRCFINPQTGRFLAPRGLGREIASFVHDAQQFSPREWMEQTGQSCHPSSLKLSDFLRSWSREHGVPWNDDLAGKHWRPNPQYLRRDEAVKLTAEYDTFAAKYGVEIRRPHWLGD